MAEVSWLEFFTLRDAGRLRQAFPDPESLQRDVSIAHAQRRAAGVLWSAGYRAQGLRLALSGLDRAAQIARDIAPPNDGAPFESSLHRLGFPDASSLAELVTDLLATTSPDLDGEVQPEHVTLYDAAISAQRRIVTAMEYATLDKTTRRRRRLERAFACLGGLAAIVLLQHWVDVRAARGRVRASAAFSNHPRFAGFRATDGDPRTEWVLPEATHGWLELAIDGARSIDGVWVLNGHNPPYNDRAVRAFRVIAFSADGNTREVSDAFPEFTDAPTRHHVNLSLDRVVRVRIEVDTWFHRGGALAEVEVERR